MQWLDYCIHRIEMRGRLQRFCYKCRQVPLPDVDSKLTHPIGSSYYEVPIRVE